MVGKYLDVEEALSAQGLEHHGQADEFLGKAPTAVTMELAGDMLTLTATAVACHWSM